MKDQITEANGKDKSNLMHTNRMQQPQDKHPADAGMWVGQGQAAPKGEDSAADVCEAFNTAAQRKQAQRTLVQSAFKKFDLVGNAAGKEINQQKQ